MSMDKPVRRIAIIGTGVIGASWAAEFLARGFDVIATDPAPNAKANLRKYIDSAWPALTAMGLSPKGSRERLAFTTDMKEALSDADFVQENGPERPDFKIKLFADMDAATPSDSIIASSSSGLTMSVMQSACKRPERCVIGHPFNPPHLIPLVEIVGGAKTSPETVSARIDFYASIGKKPIHLRKEVVGHVANRLQAALYREVVNLINLGVVDVADADTAVCWGPGLRWGVMGPNLLFHLGGGARRNSALHGSSFRAPRGLVEGSRQLHGLAGRKQANHHGRHYSKKPRAARWTNWLRLGTKCCWTPQAARAFRRGRLNVREVRIRFYE